MLNPYQHFYTKHFNSLEFQANNSTTPMLGKFNSSTKIHFLPFSDFKLCLCELDMYQSIPQSFYRTMTWKRIKNLQGGMSKSLLLRDLLCATKKWYFLAFVLFVSFNIIGIVFSHSDHKQCSISTKEAFFLEYLGSIKLDKIFFPWYQNFIFIQRVDFLILSRISTNLQSQLQYEITVGNSIQLILKVGERVLLQRHFFGFIQCSNELVLTPFWVGNEINTSSLIETEDQV